MSYNKYMKNKLPIISTAILSFFPAIASAQFGTVRRWVTAIGDIVEIAIPITAAIALLAFFWGLIKFIRSVSETGKSEGKSFMIWGLIALFVMMTVWGLVNFIRQQLNINQDSAPVVPQVPRRP
jgi:uncharacterized membrane protein YjfL (UPF0719 family)